MKNLIKKLFEKWACAHKWYVHKEIEVYGKDDKIPWKIQ